MKKTFLSIVTLAFTMGYNANARDQIKIVGKNNQELAIGLSSFSSEEIDKIKGYKSNKIEELLGYKTKSEVIHKDDMVEI